MLRDSDLVSIQEVRAKVDKAWTAFQKYRHFTQQQVDAVVEAMGAAGRANAQRLAEMAVEETGMGNVKDKMVKNLLNADLLPRYIRNMKTVGLLREVPEQKLIEVGVPVGVVAAIVPTTNPTSTVIYKTIVSLKSGNAVVISPHPRAKKCTCYTADLMQKAATEAGAPEDLIQCLSTVTLEATQALMKHEKTAVILSTGGSGIVRAAYSSGKPAYGVGPGNVPMLVDVSADIPEAVRKIVAGKSFDYGTVCSSEQTIVAEVSLRDRIFAALKAEKAYLCNEAEAKAVEKVLFTASGGVSAACVGQAPAKIAQMAGISIPADTSIIVCEIRGVGRQHPLSAEKLSPVLAVYFVPDFQAGLEACEAILRFGGLGHTCVIYATDDARVREFGMRMPAFRVLVNTPSPQGSVGVTTAIQPSMTLGCGAMGGNITSDNVGPQHLMNIKRIAYEVRKPEEAFDIPDMAPATAQAAAAAAPAPIAVGVRASVAEAVEKYLAQRGISVTPAVSAPAKPAPAAPPPVAPSCGCSVPKPAPPSTAALSAQVVDRFLSSRRPQTAPEAPPVCPAPSPAPAPAPAAPPAPPAAVEIPAPKIEIVDFVCESDVRAAQRESRKIYIGPKTIVTPSARELAAAEDTIVLAQRS
jgi:acetaldehyde dehydrogenase (acetylating)